MRRKIKTIGLLLTFLVCLSCNSRDKKEERNAMIIQVAQVKEHNENTVKEFSFISKPFRSSELSFRVNGPINRFELFAGNYYRKGEVIAQIDPRDFIIKKQRSEALYNQLKAEYERIEILHSKKNISASNYEKAKADYLTAKAAFETAENELNDTKLIAPFNGYVGEVYIEQYQDVKASQPVISFVDLEQLKIEAYVSQEVAFQKQPTDSVTLRFDATPDQSHRCKIVEVSKSTTKNNLSYLLTALMPNNDGELLSGMSGKLYLDRENDNPQPYVTVPQVALCHNPTDGDYLWVVKDSTVSRRKVKVNVLEGNGSVSIKEGVSKGEEIAVSGLRFLSEGMNIKFKERGDE